jgi:riboflavin synthase
VTDKKKNVLSFDIMKETLEKTTLGGLKAKDKVNLERALKANGRLSGHFVTGHIDGVGRIAKIVKSANCAEFHIKPPRPLMKFLAPKGSVCIDGVSLTLGQVGKNHFSFFMIPYTQQITTLGQKRAGQSVNIETDILAKYVLRWI